MKRLESYMMYNFISQFIKDNYILKNNTIISLEEIYIRWLSYCKSKNIKVCSSKHNEYYKLSKMLEYIGIEKVCNSPIILRGLISKKVA